MSFSGSTQQRIIVNVQLEVNFNILDLEARHCIKLFI